MSLNPEKKTIIKQDGNVLVTANPGTGKTRLLAYKYVDLINKGIAPEQILCLTFTAKAKREMETRILEVIKKEKIDVDDFSYLLQPLDTKHYDRAHREHSTKKTELRYSLTFPFCWRGGNGASQPARNILV